jgi:GNAT superfamily N-acetyltransferase
VESQAPQGEGLNFNAPEPLSSLHLVDDFRCGEPVLDDWLKKRALANQSSGASRTYVVTDEEGCVRGYYALAVGAVAQHAATGRVRRNMPDPIPVMVLARLAVDRHAQGQRLGGALLQDALLRTLAVARTAGVRALLVHALHDEARRFYEYYGFQPSPTNALTLMLRIGQPTDAIGID